MNGLTKVGPFFMSKEIADWVEVAKTAGAYGVRGDVRVVPHESGVVLKTAKVWRFVGKDGKEEILHPVSIRMQSGIYLVHFDAIPTKEAADSLRGRIFVRRSDFPKTEAGEHWAVDVIGSTVKNREEVTLGTVTGFDSNGAQDILLVKDSEGRTRLIPMVKAYIDAIDTENHLVKVDWELDWD